MDFGLYGIDSQRLKSASHFAYIFIAEYLVTSPAVCEYVAAVAAIGSVT